jgi:hypothetical protein
MSAFVVGPLPRSTRQVLASAIARAGVAHEFFETTTALSTRFAACPERPFCIFVDPHTTDARELVAWVRDQGPLFDVPVVAFAPIPTETAFAEGFDTGADDVVLLHDGAGVTRRVASLAAVRATPGRPETTGRAVVCDLDDRRRTQVGRTLRCAGYELAFARDLEDASRAVAAAPTSLVVLAEGAAQGGLAGAIAGLRASARSVDLPVVALGVRRTTAWSSVMRRLGRIGLLEPDSAACDLLFQVNELRNEAARDLRDLRRSPRLLHKTLCAFRKAGDMNAAYGMTYNINRGGLFVRTLDAPPRGSIAWLELRPSPSEPAVHLRGEVAWVCRSDPHLSAPSPPGFGVRLDLEDSPHADAARYVAAYDALLLEEEEAQHPARERPAAVPGVAYA